MQTGFFLDEASASERVRRDRLTASVWGTGLTPDEYLERERVLRQTVHGRLCKHTWVLRLVSGVVVASCETYRLMLQPQGCVEVIASVFVEPSLRHHRYATRLIDLLVERRREAGVDALILFSEVGESLYARSGFRRLKAPTRLLNPSSGAVECQFVSRADIGRLLEVRNEARADEIDVHASESLVGWHLERARFYAEKKGTPDSPFVGVTDGVSSVIWCVDSKQMLLRVLDSTGPASRLEEAAAHEAFRLGLRGVEIWDDAHSLRWSVSSAFEREDDIPMGQSFTPRGELFLGPLSRLVWA